MVYIFTTSQCGARILNRRFGLSREGSHLRFQVFANEEAGIRLTVTGEGSMPQAVAVSSICTRYGAGEGDFLIYIGSRAVENLSSQTIPEGILFCNKIVEPSSGKAFYPDVLYRHGFREGCIEDGGAAAAYQAGAYFFGPHRMSFFETVFCGGTKGGREGQLLAAGVSGIADYIGRLKEAESMESLHAAALPDGEAAQAEQLCRDLHCSESMRVSVMQHMRYFALSGVDYGAAIEALYAEGKLPCKDKREGKKCFEELKRRLL